MAISIYMILLNVRQLKLKGIIWYLAKCKNLNINCLGLSNFEKTIISYDLRNRQLVCHIWDAT